MKDKDKSLDKKQSLIHEILFSYKISYDIVLDDYCTYDMRAVFRDEIRMVCRKGKVEIIEDRVVQTDGISVWKIEIKYKKK